jgi:5-methylcytosine-specific restriction endonuclease McrA
MAAAIKFRNSMRYRNYRRSYIIRNPLCCDPLRLHPDTVTATELLHHIIPLQERLDLSTTDSNCAPLCDPCHQAIEALVRAGKQTKQLFIGIEIQPNDRR